MILHDILNGLQSNMNSNMPLFIYVGIGTANYLNALPESNLRHEFPDYVRDMTNYKKILILFDLGTKIPLEHYGYDLVNIENIFESEIAKLSDKINNFEETKSNTNSTSLQNFIQNLTKYGIYSKYVNLTYQQNLNGPHEIYVVRNNFYMTDYDENICQNEIEDINYIKQSECNDFLLNLVKIGLGTNPNTLITVSAFNGPNYYHLQDKFIANFDLAFQTDVRNRFLIDSRYYADTSCYCELSNPNFQPIISDGRFYNPGLLTAYEFNKTLFELTMARSEDKFNLIIKRKIFVMRLMFEFINKKNFNSEYINIRRLYFEAIQNDNELAEYLKSELLNNLKYALLHIEYFVDINKLFDEMKFITPYKFQTMLKKITDQIFDID